MVNIGIKIITFLMLFCFVFGPRLKVLDILLFTSICLVILSIFVIFRMGKINNKFIVFSLLVLCSLLYTLLIVSIFNYQDTTILELNLKYFLYLFSSYFAVYCYLKIYKSNFDVKINYHIFIIGLINSIFVLLVFMFDGFREQMSDILNYNESGRMLSGERSFDISMGGAALGSIVFSLIFIQGLFLKECINNTLINIGLIIISIATLLLARTGLVIIIISFIFYMIYKVFSKNHKGVSKSRILSIIISASVIILFIVMIIQVTPKDSMNKLENKVLPWAFEFYYSYVEDGEVSTYSTDVIFNKMYFLPSDSMDVIFGTSNMGRSDNLEYIPSDVGFIRIIFAIGIIGLILIFIPTVYMFYIGLKNRKNSISANMLLLSVIILFITNFKELVFLPRGGSSILFIFFTSSLIHKNYFAEAIKPNKNKLANMLEVQNEKENIKVN